MEKLFVCCIMFSFLKAILKNEFITSSVSRSFRNQREISLMLIEYLDIIFSMYSLAIYIKWYLFHHISGPKISKGILCLPSCNR